MVAPVTAPDEATRWAIGWDVRFVVENQLFNEDYVLGTSERVRSVLNQPGKHLQNPLMRRHQNEKPIDCGTVVRDGVIGTVRTVNKIIFR